VGNYKLVESVNFEKDAAAQVVSTDAENPDSTKEETMLLLLFFWLGSLRRFRFAFEQAEEASEGVLDSSATICLGGHIGFGSSGLNQSFPALLSMSQLAAIILHSEPLFRLRPLYGKSKGFCPLKQPVQILAT